MACGDKYAYLLVTADGLTPDDPWGWAATAWDYDAWYDVVQNIGREVIRRWDWVLSIEDKYSRMRDSGQPTPVDGPYPERDWLLQQLTAFTRDLEDLRHVAVEALVPGDLTWQPTILKTIAIGRKGTCVMELLDEATEYYERPVLPDTPHAGKPPPGKGSDKPGIGGVLLTLGLVGGGAWWWWRRKKAA